jgi:hypothetical protein
VRFRAGLDTYAVTMPLQAFRGRAALARDLLVSRWPSSHLLQTDTGVWT